MPRPNGFVPPVPGSLQVGNSFFGKTQEELGGAKEGARQDQTGGYEKRLVKLAESDQSGCSRAQEVIQHLQEDIEDRRHHENDRGSHEEQDKTANVPKAQGPQQTSPGGFGVDRTPDARGAHEIHGQPGDGKGDYCPSESGNATQQ